MVDERLLHAEEQVEAFISILSKRYGIKEDEIPKLIDGLRWTMEHRDNIHRISWHALLGVVGALVAGFALMIWEGFKHVLSK